MYLDHENYRCIKARDPVSLKKSCGDDTNTVHN